LLSELTVMSGRYVGDSYHAFNESMSGNSMMTTRSGDQWPTFWKLVTSPFREVAV